MDGILFIQEVNGSAYASSGRRVDRRDADLRASEGHSQLYVPRPAVPSLSLTRRVRCHVFGHLQTECTDLFHAVVGRELNPTAFRRVDVDVGRENARSGVDDRVVSGYRLADGDRLVGEDESVEDVAAPLGAVAYDEL